MGESVGESSAREELGAYYSTLPEAFKNKLEFGRKGIPGDFVNNFAGMHVHIQFVMEGLDSPDGVPVRDVEDLNYYISCMRPYRVYLEGLIRQVLDSDPGIRIDVRELMVRLMDVPLVAELEADIAEIRGMRFEPGPEFLPKLERLKELVDLGVAIIKDTIAEDQVRAMFPAHT